MKTNFKVVRFAQVRSWRREWINQITDVLGSYQTYGRAEGACNRANRERRHGHADWKIARVR